MAASKRTKHCKKLKLFFNILHLLCLFGPMLYFIPYGFITGEVVEKICLSFTVILSIIFSFISLIVGATAKAGLQRSVMWILIAGILFCLKEIQIFIWIMCITSILDELIFSKLKDHFKQAYVANVEIDKRGIN